MGEKLGKGEHVQPRFNGRLAGFLATGRVSFQKPGRRVVEDVQRSLLRPDYPLAFQDFQAYVQWLFGIQTNGEPM